MYLSPVKLLRASGLVMGTGFMHHGQTILRDRSLGVLTRNTLAPVVLIRFTLGCVEYWALSDGRQGPFGSALGNKAQGQDWSADLDGLQPCEGEWMQHCPKP